MGWQEWLVVSDLLDFSITLWATSRLAIWHENHIPKNRQEENITANNILLNQEGE